MALVSAMLFGLSTPFAKLLGTHIGPVMLAGLLYLGSGVGLGIWYLINRLPFRAGNNRAEATISKTDWPWLFGAILAGGILAPILLLTGLARTTSSSASLLLNFEGVFTLALAWFVFNENFDRRVFIGVIAILAGGILLSWSGGFTIGALLGPVLILGACLAWGVDNNLTRRISAGDPVQIAALKGLTAGTINIILALLSGHHFPPWPYIVAAGIIGLFSYGLSLMLFVVSLRNLGAARTSAYFAVAPFVGALGSFIILSETLDIRFALAALLMGIGIYLHITEQHHHEHTHIEMAHEHRHTHDEHHRHPHDFEANAAGEHSHQHVHAPLIHVHPHFPDLHHRHGHD